MVRMSQALSEHVTIRDTAKELLCHELGTIYKALSADAATKYGQISKMLKDAKSGVR